MRHNLPPILTSETAKQILEGKTSISLDLGLSKETVSWKNTAVNLAGGEYVDLIDLKKIAEKKDAVFFTRSNKVYQVALARHHFYKLLPTEGAPTLEIDGIRMHRTKETTPDRDSVKKVELLEINGGIVLDTCTGLGYTAIEASKAGAYRVVTIELEPCVHRIALINPWSQRLYNDPNIYCIIGDSYYMIDGLHDELFCNIIHDPPRHGHAGHLYGLKFYQKLYRVLSPEGALFHYTGAPRSKYRGVNIQRGVSERLLKAGFNNIKYHEEVMGVTALKP